MNESLVGVDLGGTQVRAIVCDREGHILSRAATLTLAHEGRDAVIRRILDTIIDAVGPRLWTEIAGIGVGAPGPLNPYSGVVVHAPNLPGWEDVPLRQLIAERFCLPVALGNDANLAALGEQRFGAGRGVDDLVYMTISTGIGGGIISGGELFLGHGGFAGEVGHQTILAGGPLCGCGNHGCLEALAAGPAIGRMGREAAEEGRGEALLALAGGDVSRISARVVSQAAAAGDATAIEIIRRAATYIGIGLANLANILNPELYVLGGGVTHAGPLLFDTIRETIRRTAMLATRDVRVERAVLGDDVVLWGAVALIARQIERNA
jgi:glucokinase